VLSLSVLMGVGGSFTHMPVIDFMW
jgi:hypothetical protein